MVTVLLVPGYTGSGPEHWQSLWQAKHPAYCRVEQLDWNRPERGAWVEGLERAVRIVPGPVVLVGHSCGTVTVAHWAAAPNTSTSKVAAALLVTPGDCDALDALPDIRPLGPMPTDPLPFKSLLVASTNDPHMSLARAEIFAELWGSELHVVGAAGHLNMAAGYGPWPEGEQFLQQSLTGSANRN